MNGQRATTSPAGSCTRELFVQRGLRCTKQRLAIYEALRASRTHPTAEALYRMVKPRTSQLSLATVYNALEALCEAGLVRKMPTTNGCCCYDADPNEHPHVRFTDTGEIADVPHELGERLLENLPQSVLRDIERATGAEIESVNIQLLARRNGHGSNRTHTEK